MKPRSLIAAQISHLFLIYTTPLNPGRMMSGLRNDRLLLTNSGNRTFFCVIFSIIVAILFLFGLLICLHKKIPPEEVTGGSSVYPPTVGKVMNLVSTGIL